MVLIVVFVALWILAIISFFFSLPYIDYIFADHRMLSFIGVTNAFVLVGVPLLAIVLFVGRVIFRSRVSTHFRTGMWAFWLLNLVSFVLTLLFLSRNFNYSNHIESAIGLEVQSDTLRVEMQGTEWDSPLFQMGHLYLDDDQMLSRNVNLNVVKSEDDQFHFYQRIRSRGSSRDEAERLASDIKYEPVIEDGKIILPRSFSIPKGVQWRVQEVELELEVPEGKFVELGNDVGHTIYNFEVNNDADQPWSYSQHTWRMDAEGFVCPDHIAKNNYDQDYDLSDFTNLMIEGKIKIEIEQGDEYRVRITGKEVYTKQVDVVQHTNSLTINTPLKRTNSPIRLHITMPVLESLYTEDTDDVKIQGFRQKSMTIKTEGAHDYKIFADIDTLQLRQEGRNEVDIRGSGKILHVNLSKNAKLDAAHFTVDHATITASDYSRARLSVTQKLIKKIEQNCSVEVEGDPLIEIDETENEGSEGG